MSDTKTQSKDQTKAPADTTSKPGTELARTQVLDTSAYESVGAIAKDEGGSGRKKTPYVGYFTEKSKAGRDAIVAAGIEPNQFYLFDNEPLKVKPFSYHLLKARRFHTKLNKEGEIVGVLLTKPNDHQYTVEKYREYIMAQVLVITKDPMGKIVLVPATWGARSGLAKVFRKALDFMAPGGAAASPVTWAARSTNHAIAANAKWPGGRFVVTAWGSTQDTLDGQGEYNLGHDSISPTSAEGVVAFNEITSGKNLQEFLLPANNSYEWRCKQLEKQAAETK